MHQTVQASIYVGWCCVAVYLCYLLPLCSRVLRFHFLYVSHLGRKTVVGNTKQLHLVKIYSVLEKILNIHFRFIVKERLSVFPVETVFCRLIRDKCLKEAV